MKRIPRVPRPTLGNYQRPGADSLVTRAGAKNPKDQKRAAPTRTSGRMQPSDTDRGWETPPRDAKPKKRVRSANNPHPHGYAPTGRHRGLGTSQTGHRGRRRAEESGYEGRHRKAYEGQHRA